MRYLTVFLLMFVSLISAKILDGIVAVVDDDIVLYSELNEITKVALAQQQKTFEDEASLKEMRHIILERIIDDRVLLARAKIESITVGKDEVQERVEQQMELYLRQAGSQEALEAELAKYNLSVSKLRKKFTKEIREQFLKLRFSEKIKQKTNITREEVEAFYQEYRDSIPEEPASVNLSHIMIKPNVSDSQNIQARNKLTEIREKIALGESFEKMAVEYSQDPSAQDSGDIGFIGRGDFGLPAFEKAAFSLGTGEVSQIVRSRVGLHLIKVVKQEPQRVHVRHILFVIKPNDEIVKKTSDKLDSIRSVAKDSVDFARLAIQFSEDENSKEKGGYLGWYTQQKISPQYFDAIKDLNAGEISVPVAVNDALHIFRVNAVSKNRKLDLQNDYTTIMEIAKNHKVSMLLEEKLKRWRGDCHIKVYLSDYR